MAEPNDLLAQVFRRTQTLHDPKSVREEDHYTILGVARDASQEQIFEAYCQRSRECRARIETAGAEAELTKIQSAYDILRDPVQRIVYDRSTNPITEAERQAAFALVRNPATAMLFAAIVNIAVAILLAVTSNASNGGPVGAGSSP
jgi:DnaJ-class molecular chaperone